MNKLIRIGTRKSKLALVQTYLVRDKILELFPDIQIEIVEISTQGDELLNRSLASFGGKGVFTRELEEALLTGRIDLAVHSAKDMPMEFPDGLGIGAVLTRANPADVLVTVSGVKAADLPAGSIVGTSSLRRELQIKDMNPQVHVRMLRGNVQTRLRKLEEGKYDGILLAAAGLERLGCGQEPELHFEYLDTKRFLPAAGQGILAVESRIGEHSELLSSIHSAEAALMLRAERAFLTAIGGSCNAPAAAYCRQEGSMLCMSVLYAKDGIHRKKAEGSLMLDEKAGGAEELGRMLAAEVKKGMVYLIGAGPGDNGLITVKGLECVREADVIVYDNLISNSILNEAKEDAELIYAGKRSASHHMKQEDTNALLVRKAKEGKNVVRLKGGDPFIFGRGGEEAAELSKQKIAFEIVPGVSSSYGVAAYAGIPVTHRNMASSFHVITGHEGHHKSSTVLDYSTLAKEEGTLVFMMGLHNLPNIAASLIAGGKAPGTPAAVIQEGTTAKQRAAVGTLETIVREVEKEGICTPAVTVVGEVVSLRESLKWFGGKPLFGRRVLVTGTKHMADLLAEQLAEQGAEPVKFSLIQTRVMISHKFEEAAADLSKYTWAVFTSSNGVNAFFDYLIQKKIDIRSLAHLKIAVIGDGTAKALAERGLQYDCIPERYSSNDLAKAMIPNLTADDKVLLLRAKEASREITDALALAGIEFTDAALYETRYDMRKKEELNRILETVDYITFASSSAVKAYMAMADEPHTVCAKVICIGPVTEKTAADSGLTVYKTASLYTAEGIRDVLLGEVL